MVGLRGNATSVPRSEAFAWRGLRRNSISSPALFESLFLGTTELEQLKYLVSDHEATRLRGIVAVAYSR